jgi:uncharacterized protein (TIGR00297 family)
LKYYFVLFFVILNFMQLITGFFLALAIALAAYALGALSHGGALVAVLSGTVVYGLGGLEWAVILVAFFVSSSLLSHLAKRSKAGLEANYAKGGRRDAGQVLANGGAAGLAVLLHALVPAAGWPVWVFTGALAAANADTWATELGVLSRSAPRMITNGKVVERGTSGAVSGLGLAASLAGAAFIAGLAALLFPAAGSGSLFWMLTLAGLGGSLLDSLLGASLQAIYQCPACARDTERHPLHTCGSQTTLARGLPWMNNDLVNLFCTLAGAVLAGILVMI